ncbi:MAG: hypothetical protein JWR69_4689 [Pedosphaera sp.]|nr:hypothetical protein [Pedosphaera sp.]
MNKNKRSKIKFVIGAAILGGLTGCIGVVDGPRHGGVYVESPVVVQDDYVYYPGYQVYYSSHTHHYLYQDGRSWVSRPTPPHVSADVLFASPSVSLDFHDAPSIHHSAVVKTYPRNWAPPGSSHGNKGGNGHDNGHGNKERD